MSLQHAVFPLSQPFTEPKSGCPDAVARGLSGLRRVPVSGMPGVYPAAQTRCSTTINPLQSRARSQPRMAGLRLDVDSRHRAHRRV